MEAKVVDILSVAFERARIICFERFDPNKWLAMSLASWLAWLGSSSVNFNLPGGSGDLPEIPQEGYDWLLEHGPWIVAGGVSVALVVTVLWLVLTWLRSRGQVMFIDLITHDSAAVGQSWSAQGPLANDLFKVRVGIDLIASVVMLIPTGATIALALSSRPSSLEPLLVPLLLSGGVIAVVGLIWSIVTFVLDEMVVPIAYAWRVPIREAFPELRRMASDTPGSLLTYLLVRFFAAFVVALFAFVLSCLLCVVSWLPFISAVLLLPLRVYLQSLPLAFLHQLNPEAYSMFGPLPREG
ncbi:MAG TPA: hypothetical protein ENK18_12965 [Deltaproteobacteria bacterium]|nr:hypothetical protein [Deltaproteobacteria bacterium]